MTYLDNAGRKKFSTNQNLFDYYADIHPKTESQFRDQKFLAGISDNYNYWMRGRSDDEYNAGVRNMYNVSFSDITYPWRSEISGSSGSAALGRGVVQLSRNVGSLYHTAKRKSAPKKKKRSRRSRR